MPLLDRWRAIGADWPAASRYIAAECLWSPGNDGACLLIAVIGFLDAFGGPTGRFLKPEVFYTARNFWVAVIAAALVPIFYLGRRQHQKRYVYLGRGSGANPAPVVLDQSLYLHWVDVFPERPIETNDLYVSYMMHLAALTAFPIGFIGGWIYFSDPKDPVTVWWSLKIISGPDRRPP